MIARDDALGQHVKSVLIDGTDNTMTMKSYKDRLAYCSLRLQTYNNLQYPDARIYCPAWRDSSLQVVFLSNTCETRCVNCGPEIWEFIHHFPRLSRLTVRYHSCGPLTLQLPVSSLPIGCGLGSQVIWVVIRSCKRLLRFHYLRPLFWSRGFFRPCTPQCSRYIWSSAFSQDYLGELVVQDHGYRIPYNETPKFGSFADFPSLQRLGVDCNTLSVQASLPPNLCLIAIQHCSSYKSVDVLLCLASHLLVEVI